MKSGKATVWSFSGGGSYSLPESPRAHLMLATTVAEADGCLAAAMTVATAIAGVGRPVLVCEPRSGHRRLAGIFSTAVSRGMAEIVSARFGDLAPVSRGPVCHLSLPSERDRLPERIGQLTAALPVSGVCIAALTAVDFRHLVDSEGLAIDSTLLLAELPSERAATALVCGELSRRGVRCRVWQTPVKGIRRQLAMLGLGPGGKVGAAADRLVHALELGLVR